ncbi:hypothetical protein RvY_17468 [Ramazzottius varieornatus]|uniref:Mediator of RNA polymerase II transcription subunit 9 n=1 Tax=Ramazzottius varieornatus TaxID=947166 RepID=A0A1D1W4F0_RAMVA|nr:hypothetical protein RvY_17468 [Ramazzottius varieornatus]
MELPENEAMSPETLNRSLEILQAVDFSYPVKAFLQKMSDPSLSVQSTPIQRAHLLGSIGELVRDVQNVQSNLTTWRTVIQQTPGIQRSAGQQMQRLENLKRALERRAQLLERHQTLLNSTRSLNNGMQGA